MPSLVLKFIGIRKSQNLQCFACEIKQVVKKDNFQTTMSQKLVGEISQSGAYLGGGAIGPWHQAGFQAFGWKFEASGFSS